MKPTWAEFTNVGAKGTLPNWLSTCSDLLFVVFKPLDVEQQHLRFKNQAQEVILLSTEGTIRGTVGLCGYVPFTETGARACKVKTEERKRSAKWIRAQDEKRQGLWEKEMEDPEDCHLERKGLAYVRK